MSESISTLSPIARHSRPSLRQLLARLNGLIRRQARSATAAIRRRYAPLQPLAARRVLFPLESSRPFGGWTFHDENWVRVIHRFEHRRLLREGRALVVQDHAQQPNEQVVCRDDGSILANVESRSQQEWVWLHLDPQVHSWCDFRWEFTVRRDTNFRELQFGFRYIDFYNRYRFRHEDDHLHFDIVVNGAFHNSIDQVPFPMELGRPYRWIIDVRDNRFILTIDGVVQIDAVDRRRRFPRGSVAVILWEDDARTPIRATITDMKVLET